MIRRAFTLMEMVVVISILIILTAITVPVFTRAKHAVKIHKSVSNMRQLYLAHEMYRSDWDGSDAVYDYHSLGLMPGSNYGPSSTDTRVTLGLPLAVWKSPCGKNDRAFWHGPSRANGEIVFAAPFYDPSVGNAHYKDYLATYRQNAVLFLDHFCNDQDVLMMNRFTSKRSLAILLSGQVVNRVKVGNAFYLQFYSDPPD